MNPPGLRASVAQLDAAVALARNQLGTLTGKGPDRGLSIAAVPASESSSGAPGLPPALPLDLLGRRPDLVAARWRVEAAAGEIDVARKRLEHLPIDLVAEIEAAVPAASAGEQ